MAEGKKWILIFWLFIFISAVPAFALDVPERPEGRVTDRTRTLTPGEIAALDQKLAAFEKQTTNQIAVFLMPSLEGDSLEDFSIRLAEKWKIGQKGRNNGVILLIVKNEKKLRIEVGYGLEGALPDALAGSIIRDEIAPRFKSGHFYQGIDAGINAIMAATKGEYKPPKKKDQGFQLWIPLVFILVFGLFAVMSSVGRKRSYHSGGSRGWTTGGGYWGGGGGSFGDSGGGFSGGGGDFGGGGASGDW